MVSRVWIVLVAWILAGLIACASTLAADGVSRVSVAVPTQPLISRALHIHVRVGGRLPRDAYFYSIAVLTNYRHHSAQAPPLCAVSSNMERAEYATPRSGHVISLTLQPAASPEDHWCPGTYTGAIYMVRPHQLCRRNAGCHYFGKLPVRAGASTRHEQEPYSYPGGLPRPTDHNSRIVAGFNTTFVTAIVMPERHRIIRHTDGPICPAWGGSLPCQCPKEEGPQAIDPTRGLAKGYGWLEVTLSYSREPHGLGSCPGGIAIQSEAGLTVASAGYAGGLFGAESGVPPDSTTTFTLAAGTWHALGFAGRTSSASTTFTVTAGHGTKTTIALP
jgi:hypothetical protein